MIKGIVESYNPIKTWQSAALLTNRSILTIFFLPFGKFKHLIIIHLWWNHHDTGREFLHSKIPLILICMVEKE